MDNHQKNPQNRKLEYHQFEGENRSLRFWFVLRNPVRVFWNALIIDLFCKYLPPLPIKPWIYRLAGIKMGRNVFICFGVELDAIFPELIEIGDNSIIGAWAKIKAHELTIHEWRKGPVKIGKNVLVGACSVVLAGVEIGDGAVVSAMSLVDRDVPVGARVEGVPIHRRE